MVVRQSGYCRRGGGGGGFPLFPAENRIRTKWARSAGFWIGKSEAARARC